MRKEQKGNEYKVSSSFIKAVNTDLRAAYLKPSNTTFIENAVRNNFNRTYCREWEKDEPITLCGEPRITNEIQINFARKWLSKTLGLQKDDLLIDQILKSYRQETFSTVYYQIAHHSPDFFSYMKTLEEQSHITTYFRLSTTAKPTYKKDKNGAITLTFSVQGGFEDLHKKNSFSFGAIKYVFIFQNKEPAGFYLQEMTSDNKKLLELVTGENTPTAAQSSAFFWELAQYKLSKSLSLTCFPTEKLSALAAFSERLYFADSDSCATSSVGERSNESEYFHPKSCAANIVATSKRWSLMFWRNKMTQPIHEKSSHVKEMFMP